MTHTTLLPLLAFGLVLVACDPEALDGEDQRGTPACPSSVTIPCEGTSSSDDGGAATQESGSESDSGASSDSSDGGESDDDGGDEVDLPYDVKPQLGDVFLLSDAFLEKGAKPAAIVAVEFDDDGDWRAAELQGDIAFEITQEDCDHEGNRDVGRDRVNITWQTTDGAEETDHLDIRYCEG